MSQPGRSKLPIRKQPFGGVANRTPGGSHPDWEELGHVELPDGAPNVLAVLIDDAGFGMTVSLARTAGSSTSTCASSGITGAR